MNKKDNQKVFFGNEKVSKLEKQKGVDKIFSKVTKNYDLMNDLMSFGAHRLWKSTFVKQAELKNQDKVLDLAGGTGDITKIVHESISECEIYLCDQNASMVDFARDRAMDEGFINNTEFETCKAENLPYRKNFFNHVFISFGFRNFSDKHKALSEILRVLKKGGTLHILEFSKVQNETFSKFYDFYSHNIIPKIGGLVSKDESSYEYLVNSIRTHENQNEICEMLLENGFSKADYENIFDGIVAIHRAKK